jgi:hypothetical protein
MVQNFKTMETELKTSRVGVLVDDLATTVGFAKPDGEELLLQRAHDPQDGIPGLAGIYVERNQQQFATYGGIAKCRLAEGDVAYLI